MHISVCCFNNILIIIRFLIKSLLLVHRKASELFQRRRNQNSVRTSVVIEEST